MSDHQRIINARGPGHYGRDKGPRSYEKGRVCACGAKLAQYTQGAECSLCEREPGRAARLEHERAEAEMLGRLWKSKEYPDGCRDCDADRRFKRRHMGKGFCSLHYQRRKRAGTLDDCDQKFDGTGLSEPPTDATEIELAAEAITLYEAPIIGGTQETFVHLEGHEEPEAIVSYVHGKGCLFDTDELHAIYREYCTCTVRDIPDAWDNIDDDSVGVRKGDHIPSNGNGGYTNPLRTPPEPETLGGTIGFHPQCGDDAEVIQRTDDHGDIEKIIFVHGKACRINIDRTLRVCQCNCTCSIHDSENAWTSLQGYAIGEHHYTQRQDAEQPDCRVDECDDPEGCRAGRGCRTTAGDADETGDGAPWPDGDEVVPAPRSKLFDKEAYAIHYIAELMQDLDDDESRKRVLTYSFSRFGI